MFSFEFQGEMGVGLKGEKGEGINVSINQTFMSFKYYDFYPSKSAEGCDSSGMSEP